MNSNNSSKEMNSKLDNNNKISVKKCLLDCDLCLSLMQILESFNTAINEEQCWAICYQSIKCFQSIYNQFNQHLNQSTNIYLLLDSKHLFLTKDGFIHQKSILQNQDTTRPLAETENKLISSLGVILFHALDYGLCEDEERSLSKPLELLIEKLTSADRRRRHRNNSHSDDEDYDDYYAKDEGIERDCHLEDHSDHNSNDINFDKVIQMCVSRLSCCDSAESHYKAVCRALVAETLELSTFLDQISKGTKELRKSSVVRIESNNGNDSDSNLDGLQFHDWARLWIQVIRELRHGVKLKKVDHHSFHHLEYELTPYEMLLDDIRSRRYKLNKVMVNGDLPQRVKKDAHALILDFIRSRPPLIPVSKRVLNPPPIRQVTLYEKLMLSIRQQHTLKPTPPSSVSVTPTHRLSSVETSRTKLSDNEITPTPRRRLIKADLTLRLSNSFDDEEDNDFNKNNNSDEKVFIEEESQSLPCQKSIETEEPQTEKKTRKFSLRNLSLRLLSHERRHSITVCESPVSSRNVCQQSIDELSDLDVNEDTRQHVASIWESHDWGRALECLSLTLQEVQHIRSVLTKAEIETLAVTKSLRDDLENGKICFTCLKTRFSFWGPWPTVCKLCERAICERCSTKMHIPAEHFDKVPIYMLSPTPSPPEEHDNKFPQLTDHSVDEKKTQIRAQMDVSNRKRSRLMKVLTLNRDRDLVLVDSSNKKSGPLVRVCRDCKILVRHLIDIGHTNFNSSNVNI